MHFENKNFEECFQEYFSQILIMKIVTLSSVGHIENKTVRKKYKFESTYGLFSRSSHRGPVRKSI